jgi:septal ring factor EnvC (AmiA/AmiB activator)
MASLRTPVVVMVFGGALLFLITSLDRTSKSTDCLALAEKIDERLKAVDADLASVTPEPTEKNRKGLLEASANLAQLAVELDGQKFSSSAVSHEAKAIAAEVHAMDEAITTMTRAIAAEQPETAKRGATELAQAKDRLHDKTLDAARSCTD